MLGQLLDLLSVIHEFCIYTIIFIFYLCNHVIILILSLKRLFFVKLEILSKKHNLGFTIDK